MLRIKLICSKTSAKIGHFKDLKDTSIKRGYKPELLDYPFKRALQVDPEVQSTKKRAIPENLPKTLPNIKNVIDKHWHILSIDEKFKNF